MRVGCCNESESEVSDVSETESESGAIADGKPIAVWRKPVCIGGCCCALVSLLVAAYIGLSYYVANIFVVLHPKVRLISDESGKPYTPMNMSQNPICQVRKHEMGACASQQLLGAFSNYSAQHPFKLVRFPSRVGTSNQQTVNLIAWWLPAQQSDAPRIVIGHGYRRNYDASYVQLPAYMLRSMGFSVLALSYRDHGASDDSAVPFNTWGYVYPYDMLGAWDYAVQDPHGELGGSMVSEKVGLMGFSMGGFVASSAFGIEPRVPALWLDSPAFDVKGNVVQGIKAKVPLPGLGTLLAPAILFFCRTITGVDLSLYTPEKCLNNGNAQKARPVALIANPFDVTVPFSQAEMYLSLFKENSQYELKQEDLAEYVCGEETHCNAVTWRPDAYRRKLCDFWSIVFDRKPSSCGIDVLPTFPECTTSACPGPGPRAWHAVRGT